jgi:sulfite exporter TauE/SafE
MWQLLLPALSLGLISSFHCVGMCGPIALALPVGNLGNTLKRVAVILYHAGRITTYAVLGLVFGLLGRQLYMAGFQRWLSITAGAVILLVLLQQQFAKKAAGPVFVQKLFYKLQGAIGIAWQQTGMAKFLFIGLLNGLLPCGMVYFALAATLGFTSLAQSVLFMAAFGMGTLPLMLAINFFGNKYLTIGIRNKMRKLVPIFIGAMGTLLILRGLNLGIPYISPYIGNNPDKAIICH